MKVSSAIQLDKMRHLRKTQVFPLVIVHGIILMQYCESVSCLDIVVSTEGPEEGFHAVRSGMVIVAEGKEKNFTIFVTPHVQVPVYTCSVSQNIITALTAPWCGQSRLRWVASLALFCCYFSSLSFFSINLQSWKIFFPGLGKFLVDE